MKQILFFMLIAFLLQSCCVYHSSDKTDNKKVTEIGIAPYGSRPMAGLSEAKNGR